MPLFDRRIAFRVDGRPQGGDISRRVAHRCATVRPGGLSDKPPRYRGTACIYRAVSGGSGLHGNGCSIPGPVRVVAGSLERDHAASSPQRRYMLLAYVVTTVENTP